MPWLAYVANFRELLWDTVIPSCGGGVGIYLIELRLSIRGLSRTGRLFARRRHQTLRHCVCEVQQRKGALVLIWIGNPSLSSHWPQSCRCSAHCGVRGTPCGGVWYDGPTVPTRIKALFYQKHFHLNVFFEMLFHLALHENNCACCHKIKNTYGLQQKVCHSALPTKYQQLNVFLYQICFVWKTNWGNLHLFFSLCDSNKNK